MPSMSSKILYRIMKSFKFNQILKRDLDQQTISGTSKKPHAYFKRVGSIQTLSIHNKDVFLIKSKKEDKQTWIIYLHGGAYVHGFQSFHWRFLKTLMKKTNDHIIAPDYPLLPNATSQDMYDMIYETYQFLLDHEHPQNIIFMGDSAGGGLALGFAQWLKQEKMRTPDSIILLSPWLDVTMNNPMITKIEPFDPILNREALRDIGFMLTKDEDPRHYRFSPLYGNLKSMGKIAVFSGSFDMLYADAVTLIDRAKEQDTFIKLQTYPWMIHTFMFFGLPESKQCLEDIVGLI